MNIDILAELDAEIAQLQRARSLLALMTLHDAVVPAKGKVGRPRKKRRNLTPEGRARIAEAVKKRWARQKAKK